VSFIFIFVTCRLPRIKANHVHSSAKPSRIDSFMKLVTPFGILESARTGLMALPRSPLRNPNDDALIMEADEVVDASQLPPG
jgi:acetolactate synthase-1/3 small subunit